MEEEIDWNILFSELDFPNLGNIIDGEPEPEPEPEPVTESPPQPIPTHSPDEKPVESSSIDEIEKFLMEDNDFDDVADIQQVSDEFFADLLVDSTTPSGSGDEVIDDTAVNKRNQTDFDVHNEDDDPVAKKQKRKLRNRDAAVRSRERKKSYVKDLEMKSRYLEGECKRLSCWLQWYITENQALRQRCAFDASSAKQESAVLLLESLLLGSLLWFLGIMCLFTLPSLPMSVLEAVPPQNGEKRGPGRVAPSNVVELSFLKSRRCKASRTKMRGFHVSGILVTVYVMG